MNRRDWAELLVASIPPEVRLAIAEAPAQALRDHLGLKVTPSEHLSRREAGGWCDGVSFSEGGEILYAPTPWSDRENFTITHELGHLLVDAEQDEEILVWSADLPAKAIEEVCDMVASRLLLSDEAIQEALGGDQPTGLAVLRLFKSSNASRQAVAVALAQRLRCARARRPRQLRGSPGRHPSLCMARRRDSVRSSHRFCARRRGDRCRDLLGCSVG